MSTTRVLWPCHVVPGWAERQRAPQRSTHSTESVHLRPSVPSTAAELKSSTFTGGQREKLKYMMDCNDLTDRARCCSASFWVPRTCSPGFKPCGPPGFRRPGSAAAFPSSARPGSRRHDRRRREELLDHK